MTANTQTKKGEDTECVYVHQVSCLTELVLIFLTHQKLINVVEDQ